MTKLPTVSIKGKKYVTVNDRLKYFRETHEGYSLETEVIEVTKETSLMRAVIRDNKGTLIATGVAREERNDSNSFVNKTSYVENCETSAWGRALANFGIGIDETVASADEVVNAINTKDADTMDNSKESPKETGRSVVATKDGINPTASTELLRKITELCEETGTEKVKLYEFFKVQTVPTPEQAQSMIASLEQKLSKKIDQAV